MTKKVAEIIVNTLASAGVKHCYGIVRDTLNLITHHINESDIEWVHVRHEEAGAFAAEGEAMLTGNLTAVAGSCGPRPVLTSSTAWWMLTAIGLRLS